MLKRMLAVGMAAVGAVMLASCGSSNSTPVSVGKGSLYVFVEDAPFSDVLSFRLLIEGLTFHNTGTNGDLAVLPSSQSLKVNFAELQDFTTVCYINSSFQAGAYDSGTMVVTVPQLVVYDPSQSPPIRSITVQLSTSGPTGTISPELNLVANQVNAVMMDFDLAHSIQVDTKGQVTGTVTPVMTFTPLTASATQGYGEMDDMVGFVESVTSNSSNSAFVGSFSMELFSSALSASAGPAITVDLTSGTKLCIGPPVAGSDPYCTTEPLNQLTTGTVVEVKGYVDSSGNIVADTVEAEDREAPENNQIAMLGYVLSTTRDPNGNLTEFDFFVRDEQPDDSLELPLDSVVQVNVPSSMVYDFSSRNVNFAGLPFGAAAITPGQELIVSGVFATQTGSPTTVSPDKITLKLQTHEGNFLSLLFAGSDDKTGAFSFASFASLLKPIPIMVFTNSQTTFINVNGLNELTPQPSLLLKGLAFYEAQQTTINGITVPAGTLVILAKQVHQLI